MAYKSIIGLAGPEFELPLEWGHIRQFAKAVGAFLPEYMEEKCPIIPPTFLLMSAYFWGYLLERPGDTVLADLEVRHSLDAGQSFTFYGDLPRAGDVLVAQTEVARYAFASGKDRSAHFDDAAARASGYPTWFSIGMLHAGYLSTYAGQWLGPANIRHFEARFHNKSLPISNAEPKRISFIMIIPIASSNDGK